MRVEYKDFGYELPGASNGEAGEKLAELFVALIRGYSNVHRILDLGCGNGYLASKLGTLGFRVTGIDASESGVSMAKTKYETDHVNFIQAEIGDDTAKLFSQEHTRFDLVLSSDVLEHLYRPAALIESASMLVKPGGYLLVGTPYHGYLKNLLIPLMGGWDAHHGVAWDGGHIKFFSAQTLGDLVVRHGFGNLKFHMDGRI